ncbi:aminopeptidase N [Augochlora pura]
MSCIRVTPSWREGSPVAQVFTEKRFETMTTSLLLSWLLLSSVSWSSIEGRLEHNHGRPSRYVVMVEPDLQAFRFTGNVTITFQVDQLIPVLILNQKNLTIKDVAINDNEAKYIRPDHNRETLTMYFTKELKPNFTYDITIWFEGDLNDRRRGFYKSSYQMGNETRWIATTHFQPTGARLAFPCWDEPEYKAIFEISIKHLPNYTAVLSNMPVLKTRNVDGKKLTIFQPTLLMSTYLVAFIVSDLAYITHEKNKNYKIYTKADSVNDTRFALDFSVKAMEQLDIVTGIPYSRYMPKMDQVTISDLRPTAMENWGLVTYREMRYLWKEGITTTYDKQYVIQSISHEFAHQWFGNLVTPSWWKYIWLNEGFATYFQYYITDKLEPSWRLMELFPVEAMQGVAFNQDGYEDTRPMNPVGWYKLFDYISYQKAACVIRMMANILTEKVFLNGLNLYLRNNAFSVADPDNLFKNLQAAAGENTGWGGASLSEIMKTWITNPGYPVVNVKKISDNYVLSQERFLFYGSDKETRWWIPITYVTEDALTFSDTAPAIWLKPSEDDHMIWSIEADWILLNKHQIGYYRVNYDDENWMKLSKYLVNNFKRIPPVNRASLIDDAFKLARNNLTSYRNALTLSLYLKNETDYIPWTTTFRNLIFLQEKFTTSKHYNIFKNYIRYIMQGLSNHVKYRASPQDSHVTKLLKAGAIYWACHTDVEECLESSKKEFDRWYRNSSYILDADLKIDILCTGLRTANESVWETVFDRLATFTDDTYERTKLLRVMGCSNNRTILEKLISMSVKTKRHMDLYDAVEAVVSNFEVSKADNISVVKFVLKRINKEYMKIMTLDDPMLRIEFCIASLASVVIDQDDVIELQKFTASTGLRAEILAGAMLQITRSIDWVTAYRSTIEGWLVEHEDLFQLTSGTGTVAFASFLLILSVFVSQFC